MISAFIFGVSALILSEKNLSMLVLMKVVENLFTAEQF